MTPLNNSIVATRCIVFANAIKCDGFNGHTVNVQLGWDPELRNVSVIHEAGCFRLFAYDMRFDSFDSALKATKRFMADSPVYHDVKFATTKLVAIEHVERDYGTNGINAIVESISGKRILICDAFGGIDQLRGGAVRWDHGTAILLKPTDTFESLRAEEWNDNMSLWDAMTMGCDDSRPILDFAPVALAKSAGIA